MPEGEDTQQQDVITLQIYAQEDGGTGMAVDLGGYSGEDWDGTGPGAIIAFILDAMAGQGIIQQAPGEEGAMNQGGMAGHA